MSHFHFQCIPQNKVCDGLIDCVTTENDEKNCEGIRTNGHGDYEVTTSPSESGGNPIHTTNTRRV